MAQKRRGLGRGLEALIPDTQKEKATAPRPSDVFFPDSKETETHDKESASHADADSENDPTNNESQSTRDLAATLLAPSQRKRSSKSRTARSTSSRTASKTKQATSVSRETVSDSADETVKKPERGTSKVTSKSRVESADKTTPKRSPRKVMSSDADSATALKAEEQSSQPEVVATEAISVETTTYDNVAAVDDIVASSASEETEKLEDSVVSRETKEKQAGGAEVTSSDSKVAQPVRDSIVSEAHAGERNDSRVDDTVDSDGPDLVPVPGAHFAEIPVGLIHPNPRQPRQVFDEEDISELAASIAEVGLLQPIVVRQVSTSPGEDPHYELIMGERRLRASKEAGLETIPAVVRDTDDVAMLRDALLENLHRVQLNPLEEAAAYQQLLEDFQCTHAELSERIARSRSQISNTLRLMKLPPLVQRRLAANVISAGHARALLGLPNAAEMERLAQRVVAEGLSVRATEELVALHEEPDSGTSQPKVLRARSTPLPALSTRLSDAFDTRVKVTRGAKKGRITIEFAGDDDLARIVGALAPGTSLDEE